MTSPLLRIAPSGIAILCKALQPKNCNPLSPPCIPPKFVLHGLSSKSKFLAVVKKQSLET